MKNIFTKIATIAATSAALVTGAVVNAPSADAAAFNLNWRGNNGYTATGSFSFPDALVGQTIDETQLTDFMISFFNPTSAQVGSFDYDFPLATGNEFNFQFNSATNTIAQSGAFDTPQGFDLGINYGANETGLDFYTSDGSVGAGAPPLGTITLDNVLAAQGCNTFPSATCDRFDTGGTLTATAVPEPASTLGLLALGALGGASTLKKKLAKLGTKNRSTEKVSA